jgi:dTMP kinase
MTFVVFEGGEGVGKSTQIEMLRQTLLNGGLPVTCTREPGGTPFAECLRRVFKDDALSVDEPTPWAELLLVASARAQHLERLIRPALAKGHWVICDRFLDSAAVYQGARGKLGFSTVMGLHALFMTPADVPDLTIILDMEPDAAISRLQARKPQIPESGAAGHALTGESPGRDRLDHMANELHHIIRNGFLSLVDQKTAYPCGKVPNRVVVSATGSPDAIGAQIIQALRKQPTLEQLLQQVQQQKG